MTEPIGMAEEERRAIENIGRTTDGHMLHRHLRRILETVHDFADEGALRTQNGRRSLARDLMAIMAKGIADTTGTDVGRTGSSNDPILTSTGRGANVTGRARAGTRRVAIEPGDGWGEFGADIPGTSSEPAGPAGRNSGSR